VDIGWRFDGDPVKRQKVLVLVHKHLVPPDDTSGIDVVHAEWKTEFDVISTLQEMGHEVRPLGIQDELNPIRQAIDEWKPTIVFNLLEAFDNVNLFDQNVVSYLELLRIPYTGCSPRGLLLARDKSLSKTLLAYHRIPVPEFFVFRRGRKLQVPRRLKFPVIVKSLTQQASIGISQASVVGDEERLRKRVEFIHASVGTHAIAERYIDGRELYVGVLGNERLQVFPVWEMQFQKMVEGDNWPIATERVKWSAKYQEKHGIATGKAIGLPDGLEPAISKMAKRVYRSLELSGYARIDLRLDAAGKVYVLEANPNPQIAYGEDFAESAEHGGLSYEDLLDRILALGLQWRPERVA
jgi:D-alanine-D-alanine ligase